MAMIFLELDWCGRLDQPVNVLIENGHANAKQAILLIDQKQKKHSPEGLQINTYGLGGKIGNPILQAADMLAYGVREYHTKGESYFAGGISRASQKGQLIELPWDKSSIDAVRQEGMPGRS